MAWFISFYKNHPDGVPPRDYHLYLVGSSLQIDSSLPGTNKQPDEGSVASAIKRFEQSHGVNDWKEVADRYDLGEVDYD
jgi:hypothetical protein